MTNQCLEQLRPLQHVRIEREHLLEVNVCHPHFHLHLQWQRLWILVAAALERCQVHLHLLQRWLTICALKTLLQLLLWQPSMEEPGLNCVEHSSENRTLLKLVNLAENINDKLK